MKLTRIALLTLVALFALTRAADASVSSAGGFKYVSKRQVVEGQGTVETVTAKCPRGTHVMAGGQETIAALGRAHVIDFPVDLGDTDNKPDDGWSTRIDLSFGSGSVTVQAEATCAKVSPAYRNATFRVPNEDQTYIAPACNGSEKALDLAIRTKNATISSSFPAGGGSWPAYIDNLYTSDMFVDTTIVCLNTKVELASKASTADAFTTSTQTVDCSSGMFAVSGGQVNGGGYSETAQTGSSTAGARSYVTTVDNFTNRNINVTTLALCMAKQR